ncbi:2og-fe oxygenase protein [Apiospora phragmitis]|uniref:2og-fe oxygenase protein n=1 Tax=Apiospora phragmitis TaxID=2905665 RepID=A0ABR1W5Z4_9PEZI
MYTYEPDSDTPEGKEDDESAGEASSQSPGVPTLKLWKRAFGGTINAIQLFGDVAWSKHCPHLMLPGLEAGGTLIPLPLVTPRDAEVIRKACHQAPFGRGEETVIDESVRKTWEVGREGFSFSNPQPDGARADPYKLLLYDPGSFFKPHKDSEKAPGMIATLLICLPSDHQGGDVYVSHNGQKQTLKTSQSSAFEVTALAWYSDVTHEIKEVTAGHRLFVLHHDNNPHDPDDDEVYHKLNHVATCDGAQVGSGMDVDPIFIGPNPYHERDADSNIEGEYWGNEPSPSEYRFHDSVAVIVRKDDLSDFLGVKSLSEDSVARNVAKLVADWFEDTTDPALSVAVKLLK